MDFDPEFFDAAAGERIKKSTDAEIFQTIDELLRSSDSFDRALGLHLADRWHAGQPETGALLVHALKSEPLDSPILLEYPRVLTRFPCPEATLVLTELCERLIDKRSDISTLRRFVEALLVLNASSGQRFIRDLVLQDYHSKKFGFYSTTAVLLSNIVLEGGGDVLCGVLNGLKDVPKNVKIYLVQEYKYAVSRIISFRPDFSDFLEINEVEKVLCINDVN